MSDGLGERINISPPSISTNPEPAPDYEAVVLIYEGAIAEQATSRVFWRIERELAEDLGARWLAAHDTQRAAEPAAPVATAPPSAASPAVPGGGVINSVELDIAVELGNVAMTIGDLLRMGHGSVVTLSQSVGDKVVMMANGTPVASGEVVIVDGTLGFRVADLITAPRGE